MSVATVLTLFIRVIGSCPATIIARRSEMVTVWLQDTLGLLMVRFAAPAVVRGLARVVPSEHMQRVEDIVNRLFVPTGHRAVAAPSDGRP